MTELELYHHGIKGQRWGFRRYQNSDGTLTEAGKKRYSSEWAKNVRDGEGKSPETVFKDSKGFKDITSFMKFTRQELDDLENQHKKLFADYEKGTTADKCGAIAGIAESLLSPYRSEKTTMKDLSQEIFFYNCSDGDPSGINSRSVYIRETGKLDAAAKLSEKYFARRDEYEKYCKDMVDELLGECSNVVISNKSSYTVGESLTNSLVSSNTAKHIYEWMSYDSLDWYQGAKGSVWERSDKQVDDAVKEAKSVVAKINFSNSKSSWYLQEAVEKAGLSDVDYKDMTDAQWKRLNEELARLGG